MTWYAYQVQNGSTDVDYLLFIGSSTWLLYSLHRIIGIERVGTFIQQGRYAIIKKYKPHIVVYACLALLICGYSYLKLDWDIKMNILIPSAIAVFYISPFFPGKKRLRDLSWIKILLIGISWSWLSTAIPMWSDNDMMIWTISRFFFLIGITIPFDLRDKAVDGQAGVKTIAHFAPANVLISLGVLSIFISLFLPMLFVHCSPEIQITEWIVHLIAVTLIVISTRFKSDYFCSFLLDGTMGLFALIYLLI